MGHRREPRDRAEVRREIRGQVLAYLFVIVLFGGIITVVILAALGLIGHTVPNHCPCPHQDGYP